MKKIMITIMITMKINKNYMGVYSSNNLTRYVNFHDVVKEIQNIHLLVLIQIETIKQEYIGRVF